jgi:hypothetical protein
LTGGFSCKKAIDTVRKLCLPYFQMVNIVYLKGEANDTSEY